MRLIKLLSLALLAVAAVLGGFVVAAIIAAATVAAWLVRRFFFKSTTEQALSPGWSSRPPTTSSLDVIDVSATEVPSASRQS